MWHVVAPFSGSIFWVCSLTSTSFLWGFSGASFSGTISNDATRSALQALTFSQALTSFGPGERLDHSGGPGRRESGTGGLLAACGQQQGDDARGCWLGSQAALTSSSLTCGERPALAGVSAASGSPRPLRSHSGEAARARARPPKKAHHQCLGQRCDDGYVESPMA